mmetsp:Transcript_14338/g.13906  ORF Transcript_14338/g.13906 Transcript_14338/m.13906 type:complete len:472 (+) Transcript_14338:733-2148(+)
MTFHHGESYLDFNEEKEEHVKQQIKRQLSQNPKKYKISKFYMDDNYEVTLDQQSAKFIMQQEKQEEEVDTGQAFNTKALNTLMDTEENPFYMARNDEEVFNASMEKHHSHLEHQYANRSISLLDQTMKGSGLNKWGLALKLLQEFKQSVIHRVSYCNSSIYGKVLFAVNNYNQMRVILFKDLIQKVPTKSLASSHPLLDCTGFQETLKEVPNDFIITRIISLKYDLQQTPSRKSMIQNPLKNVGSQKGILHVKNPICYADFIIIVYWNQTFFDIFKKNGTIVSRQIIPDIQESKFAINTIEDVLLPRLDWSDRYFDMMQQKQNELCKKLILMGTAYMLEDKEAIDQTRKEYHNMKMWNDLNKENKDLFAFERSGRKKESRMDRNMSGMSYISKLSDDFTSELELVQDYLKPYIMIYDRVKSQPTLIKLIQVEAFITQLKYGPYDNGYIICGLSNGILLIFNTVDLTRLLQL